MSEADGVDGEAYRKRGLTYLQLAEKPETPDAERHLGTRICRNTGIAASALNEVHHLEDDIYIMLHSGEDTAGGTINIVTSHLGRQYTFTWEGFLSQPKTSSDRLIPPIFEHTHATRRKCQDFLSGNDSSPFEKYQTEKDPVTKYTDQCADCFLESL
ncbi:hypothetical protein V1478_013284 [Vespula squamosa]|uniref:Uncharacterized protein n=1 Tax=Vespula squamosa TaxID=30214 RepID=A0ABD2AAF1_VESSQ